MNLSCSFGATNVGPSWREGPGASTLRVRGGLAEHHLLGVLAHGLAESRVALRGAGIGRPGGGALRDGAEPALQMRVLVEVLALLPPGHDPRIGRHVGDAVIIARHEGA